MANADHFPDAHRDPAGLPHGSSDATFRALVEAFPDALLVVAQDGRIRLVNGHAEALFGYAREELIGRAVEALVPHRHAAGHPMYRDAYSRTPHLRPMGGGLEITGLHKDGSEIPVEVSLSPFRTGGDLLVIASVRDMSERRRLQQNLEPRNETLRRAHRLEAIGRLAGGIAHEFNNILGAIKGFSGLVQQRLTPGSALIDDMLEIDAAADRAAKLTSELLAFSRRQVLRPQVTSVSDIVRGIERVLLQAAGDRVAVTFDLSPAIVLVEADPRQLEQVLLIFLERARDAMSGGGEVLIATSIAEIDEEGGRTIGEGLAPGSYACLSIRDDGGGISRYVQGRLFEPFFSTAESPATGLGLAIAYGIVKQTGGDIDIESEIGSGTTFKVYLPRRVRPAGRPARRAVGGTPTPRPVRTVLVAEDERALREVFERAFERHGYQVLSAENGAQALDVARAHAGAIDVLVSDVVMPRMGGPELAEALRLERPNLAVVLISGYSDTLIETSAALHHAMFLPKPFSMERLVSVVETAIAEHAAGGHDEA